MKRTRVLIYICVFALTAASLGLPAHVFSNATDIGTLNYANNADGTTNSSSNTADTDIDVFGTWNSNNAGVILSADGGRVFIDGSYASDVVIGNSNYQPSTPFDFTVATASLSNGTHTVQLYPASQDSATLTPTNTLTFYIQHAPVPPSNATVTITPDRTMPWHFPMGNLCSIGACTSNANVGVSYSFNAATYPTTTVAAQYATAVNVGYTYNPATRFISMFLKTAQASTSNGTDTCNNTPGGTCSINLQSTYCTIKVMGNFNGTDNIATNGSFTITGASNFSGTDTTGTTTFTQALADSSGTGYTFSSTASTSTIQSVNSDVYGSSYASSNYGQQNYQTCQPGQTLTFRIYAQSKPILKVQ